jgi:hypothetical protein
MSRSAMEQFRENMDRQMIQTGVADEGVREREAQRRRIRALEDLAALDEARARSAAGALHPESPPTTPGSPPRPPVKQQRRRTGPGTEAAWEAFGAYLKHQGVNLPTTGLAPTLKKFADKHGTKNAETLNPAGALKNHITALMRGYLNHQKLR